MVLFEIIGIVKDRRTLLLEEEDRGFFYFTMFPPGFGTWSETDEGFPTLAAMRQTGRDVFVRFEGGRKPIAAALPSLVRNVDEKVSVSIESVEEIFIRGTLFARLLMAASLTLGFLALILASIGIFTLMSLVVSLRTKEIGVRMALGARRAEVLFWILKRAMRMVLIGIAVGLPLCAGLSQFLSRAVFGLRPFDPLLFVEMALALSALALLASVVPARRAARVDPMEALRCE